MGSPVFASEKQTSFTSFKNKQAIEEVEKEKDQSRETYRRYRHTLVDNMETQINQFNKIVAYLKNIKTFQQINIDPVYVPDSEDEDKKSDASLMEHVAALVPQGDLIFPASFDSVAEKNIKNIMEG